MGQVINALIIVLLLVSIVAVLRLLQVMKRLETTLDTTQKDVTPLGPDYHLESDVYGWTSYYTPSLFKLELHNQY